ncbi:hypothetical protein CTI12_AA458970 [Artemisia annua]|uniref:Zinc knuckle CX2CX4HX4C n=1 Tax=Artemisia annua TaxID=35608 RepID=A0A2U1LSR7_ARTAN|nr:hypothetical protein CTI12_AA458970 [Artemisia annua]
MSPRGRASKRKTKLPNRFKDTDYEALKNSKFDTKSDDAKIEETTGEKVEHRVDDCSRSNGEVDVSKSASKHGNGSIVEKSVDQDGLQTAKNIPADNNCNGKEENGRAANGIEAIGTDQGTPESSNGKSINVEVSATPEATTQVYKSFASTVMSGSCDLDNKLDAIASSLGKPLLMDKTTAKMCHEGIGRVGYARVLIEVNTSKEFKKNVEVCYRSGDKKEECLRLVDVEYTWRPVVCNKCAIFGHSQANCGKCKEVNVESSTRTKNDKGAGYNRDDMGKKNRTSEGNGQTKDNQKDNMQNRIG